MININLTKKQSVCWKYLTDKEHTEVFFGGSKAGGKTRTGCTWAIYMCLTFPGVRGMIGRTVLTQLRMSTIKTLLDLLNEMGLVPERDYKYNSQTNELKFTNGSELVFKDLQYYPSDPLFDSLGGLEITFGFIDEAQQVTRECYNIVKSLMRYRLNEFDLIPKLLITANPSQNFLKSEFYLPHMKGELEPTKAYVPALASDNPYLPTSYIDVLKSLPKAQMERLLLGSWEYNEDADALFDYDDISNSIYRSNIDTKEKKYISIDPARYGDDSSVCILWVGLTIIEIQIYRKLSTTQLAVEIQSLIKSHGVHPNNIVCDNDGISGAIVDQIKGSVGFTNNSSPLHKENYSNLKSQCYSKLAELFKEGKISININNPNQIDDLTQELLSMKYINMDKDQKIQVMSKEQQKKILGRSPDIADAMAFRMYYELKNKQTTGRYSVPIRL